MTRLPPAAIVVLLLGCGGNPAPERVSVPPGSTFSAVIDSLQAHRVIGNRLWFTLLARVRGADRAVRAGAYEFAPRQTAWQVLDILAEGREASRRFTVPEGLTVLDVAALAWERLGIPGDAVLAAARDSAAASRTLGFPVASYEGFLRPETYSVPLSLDAAELVRLMAEAFKGAWKPEWTARLDTLHLTQLQLVTLASIVEGEARADEERETIAGVYHNRLRIGMALQADPTIQYAIALKTGQRKPRLYVKDYQFPSPYNTYLHPGLPPGPVNSPSRRCIEAAL
jgi:UPF0755 protein